MKARLFAVCLSVCLMAGVVTPVEGGEWIHFGLSGKTVNSIEIDRANPDRIFAAAEEGLYRTTNGGASWDTLEPGLLFGMKALTIDLTDPRVLYAVRGAGGPTDGLYKTTDGGDSWEMIYGLTCGTSLLLPHPSVICAGAVNDLGGGGFHVSIDGGASWDTLNEGLTNLNVLSLGFVSNSAIHLAGTQGGIFRLMDSTWTWVGPAAIAFILDFAGGDLNPDAYAAQGDGSWSDGIYKSTDLGQSWELKCYYLYADAVTVNPGNESSVYAGAPERGVLRSTDAGQNWEEMNQGLTDLDVKELALSPTDTTWLYAGTEGGGIFRYGLGMTVEETAKYQSPITKTQFLQNFPNPFSHSTTIRYSVQHSNLSAYQRINVSVYDLDGRLVKVLADHSLPTSYLSRAKSRGFLRPASVVWEGTNEVGKRVLSGVYFCRLSVRRPSGSAPGGEVNHLLSSKKLVIIR